MSASNELQDLLRKGIEAAREGNKSEARQFFEQVVEKDDKNEKGWFWLASVVETDEERRICLNNVLTINPNNERARQLMDKLEAKQSKTRADEEMIPGITRRQLTLIGGGGGAVIVLILVLFLIISGNRSAQVAAETQAAVALVVGQTETIAAQQTAAAAATQTQQALVTSTPTFTNTPAFVLPTEIPATATATAPVSPTPLPPPSAIQGRIVAWSGQDIAQTGFLPLVIFSISNGQAVPAGGTGGRNPVFSPDGQRIAYTRYFPATFDFGLAQVSGGSERILSEDQPIIRAQMPAYCATTNFVAFVALPVEGPQIDFSNQGDVPYQVYILNLDTNELRRMTNDQATYTYPAISPDCTRIAAVRNDTRGVAPGEDIVIIDMQTFTQTPLTTDLGNFIESSPRWSPDGASIIYAAYQSGQPTNSDILMRPSNGSGTPNLPVRDPADDIFPVYSPDGRYFAFASNRSGVYDIYIFDQVDSTLFQLTSSSDADYPGGWAVP